MPTAPHDGSSIARNVNSTETSGLRIEYSPDGTKIWCNKRQRWVAAHGEGFEEEVRQRTLIELVTHYRYPMSLIGVERNVRIRADEHPRRADIVIYKGENYQGPFIVIENKRPEAGPGIDQAQAYAKILGAEYAKYTDNNENRTRRLAYGLGPRAHSRGNRDTRHPLPWDGGGVRNWFACPIQRHQDYSDFMS